MSTNIRQTRPSDSPSLSRICLLTADAGSSAEHLHATPDLPGLVYALPYNKLETTFGFVLVDEAIDVNDPGKEHNAQETIVGYILGTSDSRKFAELAEKEWWPVLRENYSKADDPTRTPADMRYISVIRSPQATPEDITARFPAHVHIDILPSHQRKSYGKKLMAAAVKYLREREATGLHVGLDPRNDAAKKFYARLGFERIEIAGGEWWGLTFNNFRE